MKDYKLGKIYKLTCNTTGIIYIGSTTTTLNTRLIEHKAHYQTYLNGKRNFLTSFEIIQGNNYQIELIEDYECSTKEELLLRERYYIDNTECVNKVIPGRTLQEYYSDNKEVYIESRKKYNENNKERMSKYQKEYHLKNKERIHERVRKFREKKRLEKQV